MMAREAECDSGIGGGNDWRDMRSMRDGVVWVTAGVDQIVGCEGKVRVDVAWR